MYMAGDAAIKGHIDIGAFAVLLSTTTRIGGALAAIFASCFRTAHGYSSIVKVSQLLNAMTRRKNILHDRSQRSRQMKTWVAQGECGASKCIGA